jgi:redox-sensing transcriptional repressor
MAVIRRLPKYYRYLSDLFEKGVNRISSKELSQITGFTASQIRQDLNNFGGFGQQGYGYNVSGLRDAIASIIGLDKQYRVVIAGAGNMGSAIANYGGFHTAGFDVLALFDTREEVIGTEVAGKPIKDIRELGTFIDDHRVEIIVISTPKHAAQGIADIAVSHGVTGIWNYAPVDIRVPDNIVVENVHLNESLFTLSYLMKEEQEEQED